MSNMSFDDESTIQKTGFEKEPRWDEAIKWHQFIDDNNPYSYRLVAASTQFAQHWLKSKKKSGEKGKSFAVLCRNFDSKTNKFAENGCEVCDLYQQLVNNSPEKEIKGNDNKIRKVADLDDDLKGIKARVTFCSNAISRDLQLQGPPANNAGKWSFIVPIKIPQGCAGKLKDAQDKFNKHRVDDGNGGTVEKIFGLHHRQYGKDFSISYNSATDPNNQYNVYLGPKDPVAPLTADELGYSSFLVDFAAHLKFPDQASVKDSLTKHGYYEVLQAILDKGNIKKLERGTVVAPKQPAAPAAPAAKTAFDEGGTGMAEDDIPVDMNQLKGGQPAAPAAAAALAAAPAAPAQPAAPAVPAAPAAAPAAPAAAPAAAAPPVQQPAAAEPAAQPAAAPVQPAKTAPAGKDVQANVVAYAGANGLALVTNEKQYAEDLRFVQQGTQVPSCFSKYQAVPVCKGCPIKVDCMLVG